MRRQRGNRTRVAVYNVGQRRMKDSDVIGKQRKWEMADSSTRKENEAKL